MEKDKTKCDIPCEHCGYYWDGKCKSENGYEN